MLGGWMVRVKAAGMQRTCAFLGRFARDVGGNTLAIMAAALIPLAGLIGGGIDISRMYITKTRLQHACDAGALAGRKAMGGGTWAQTVNGIPNYPNANAERFFDANFDATAYGLTVTTPAQTRSFTENAGKVSGTATAILPMTLMKIFAIPTQTLSVTCATEMRLPNTDVMFVLDTTGSMAEIPSGDTQSKLASLKVAVKCFYEIVARLNTDATCTTGTPGGGTGSQVQLRFGFVPYSTNVNVGKLLPTAYFADSWPYQSREPHYSTVNTNTWVQQGDPTVTNKNISQGGVAQNQCTDATAAAAGYNSSTDKYTNNNNTKTNTTVNTHITSWSGNTCYGTQTTTVTVYSLTSVPTKTFDGWRYGQISQNVSGLKNGTAWNTSFTLPLANGGANKTITWDGCIEERHTVRATSYDPLPSDADDLNIDEVPDSNKANTLWGPLLPGVIYTRNGNAGWTMTETNPNNPVTADYGNQSSYTCPTTAKKMQTWPDANAFDSYVDSLVANANTYHDIGLIWGARLLSPTGIFASENAFTSQGGEIQRNLIFMTDGDSCTDTSNYQAYGVAWFDRRQTDPNSVPTEGCTTTGTLTQQVNARTVGLCTAIKNKNITLWVITFGSVASSTVTRLTNCASPGRYFSASNAATLQSTFASIANQISQLRLVQ